VVLPQHGKLVLLFQAIWAAPGASRLITLASHHSHGILTRLDFVPFAWLLFLWWTDPLLRFL
jgi:hypothetical protein